MGSAKLRDIVVIFPSDNEYNVDEIQKIVEPLLLNHTEIAFEVERSNAKFITTNSFDL